MIGKVLCALVFNLCALASAQTWSNQPELAIEATTLDSPVEITRKFTWAEDGSGEWSVLDAQKQLAGFKIFEGQVGAGNLRERVFWFHLSLANLQSHPAELLIELANSEIEDVQIFRQEGGKWIGRDMGKASDRLHTFANTHPVATLSLPAAAREELFLRITGVRVDTFPFSIYSPRAYLEQQRMQKLVSGSGIGLLSGLFVYHLVSLRRRQTMHHWLLAGFCLVTIGATGARTNDLHALTELYPWLTAGLREGLPLVAIALHALITQQLFDTQRRHQNTHKLLRFYSIYAFAWAVAVTVGVPEALMMALLLPVSTVAMLLFLRLGWTRARQGHTPAVIFLIASALLVISGMLLIALSSGLIPHFDLLMGGASAGTGLGALALTIAFVSRDTHIQRQRAQEEQATAQERALNVVRQALASGLDTAIRPPLGDCLGLGQLMRRSPIPAGANAALWQIEQSGLGLLSILDDTTQLQSDRGTSGSVAREDTELSTFLGQLLDVVAAGSRLNSQEVALILAPDVPPQCKIDRRRLREVLLDLINIGLATGPAGVVLRCRVEELRAGSVLLQFEVEARQADRKTLPEPDLASNRYLEEMGGTLRSHNRERPVFTFSLPCPIGFPPMEGDASALQGIRVGLAGGSPFMRGCIQEQLALWGASTLAEESLQQGERAQLLLVLPPPVDEDALQLLIQHYRSVQLAPRVLILLDVDARPSTSPGPGARLMARPSSLGALRHVIPEMLNGPVITEAAWESTQAERTLDLRVLLAEHDPTSQAVLQALLRQLGCSVKAVPDGSSALEELKAHPQDFDAILLDAEMPMLDGYQCAREIRTLEAAQKIPRLPVLLLTGTRINPQRGRGTGIDLVLTKPVLLADLQLQLGKTVSLRHAP